MYLNLMNNLMILTCNYIFNLILKSIRKRNDFGKLIQVICKCCGPQAVYTVFVGKLQSHVIKA